jgi:hypothetical protein
MPRLLRQMMLQNRLMSPEGDDAPHVAPTAPVAPVQGKETFSREYVQELRSENASYRTRAVDAEKKAQEAETKAAEKEAAAEAKATKAAADADAKVKETHTASDQRIIRAELKAEAIKAGMVDLDGLKLADLSTVTLDDKGEVVGAEAMLKALKEAKPYLFKEASSSSHAGDPPPKEKPKPFNARTATPEEIQAKAREMGLKIKTH